MIINCSSVIECIENVLDQYKKNEEFEFWWMPGIFPKTNECAWDKVAPEMIDKYEKLVARYRQSGGLICSISEPLDTIIGYFDEYLGDNGRIAESFCSADKKVTLLDYSRTK